MSEKKNNERRFGKVQSYSRETTKVAFVCEHGVALIRGISRNVVKLTLSGRKQIHEESYSIERELPCLPVTVRDGQATSEITSGNIVLEINKQEFSVTLKNAQGRVLTRGLPIMLRENHLVDRRHTSASWEFYGLGEKMSQLGRKGTTVKNWNTDVNTYHSENSDAMYASLPFFAACDVKTGEAWGYFLDSTFESIFNLGATHADHIDIENTEPHAEVYLISGRDIKEVLQAWTNLTGTHPLPPIWALGYHQSRWGMQTVQDVEESAKKFRDKKIPCDAMWYDIDYMENFRVFTFDGKRFKGAKEHMKRLSTMGFHKVAIVDPGVKADTQGSYSVHDSGMKQGVFIKENAGREYVGKVWPGGTKFPDFTMQETQEWWADCHKKLFENGIDGIWNDMNEPADFSTPEKTLPNQLRLDDNGRMSPLTKLHNVYATFEAKATHKAFEKFKPEERPFLLTRAAFAGMQKYAAIWTGDNASTWHHLKASISQQLNLGMSGMGFCGADIGGFNDNATAELLVRWMQMGAFTPFFRNHSGIHSSRQEPWAFGEAAEDLCRSAIQARYHFLPLIYQLFHEMNKTGIPLMRPLFMEFPNTRKAYTCDDQFLVGRALLVAPQVERGKSSRLVLLPEGSWTHYFTGKLFKGGEHVVETPMESLPLFVRQGAILPVCDKNLQHTADIDTTSLTLEVFPGGSVKEIWYEDDMKTLAWKDGGVVSTALELSGKNIIIRPGEKSKLKNITVKVINPAFKGGADMKLDGTNKWKIKKVPLSGKKEIKIPL